MLYQYILGPRLMSFIQWVSSIQGCPLRGVSLYCTYSVNLASMQQGIKKLQWFEYLKLVFLEILNPLLCRVFANQVTYIPKLYTNIIDSYS